MRFSLASLCLALATAGISLVAGNPTTTLPPSLNPDISVLQSRSVFGSRAPAPRPAAPMTNAKRLALGLPLNPPRRSSPGTKARLARRSGVPPVSTSGYIKVTNTDTRSNLGYIASKLNDFGEYGYLVSSKTGALQVSFSYQATDPSHISIMTTNGPDSNSPFFGGIVGYASSSDDLGSGNPNYNYIGGTTQTPSNAPPTNSGNSFEDLTQIEENIESAIWNYDPVTGDLSPQWINTDNTSPASSLVYVSDEPLFAITGDSDEFKSFYGVGASVVFTFTLL